VLGAGRAGAQAAADTSLTVRRLPTTAAGVHRIEKGAARRERLIESLIASVRKFAFLGIASTAS
jgi:hypothetical protein